MNVDDSGFAGLSLCWYWLALFFSANSATAFIVILWSACLLDYVLGDPPRFPHPVRFIGSLAARTETLTRNLSISKRSAGRLSVFSVLFVTGIVSFLLLFTLSLLPIAFFWAGAACLLYTTVALRDLIRHAQEVYFALGESLQTARSRVAMLVGRDTEQLDEAGVIRACVESVAENMSDGIIAPLFWATVGALLATPAQGPWPVIAGVTAAMLYKGVNTMDSMFGYKNAQYLVFGSCAARLDDAVNLLPARISGIVLMLAAPLCRLSLKNSWRILIRDRTSHCSPNAGWPEAAVAGALGLQLGGDSCYFGNPVTKPFIGDNRYAPVRDHILQACRLVLIGFLLFLLLLTSVCSVVLYFE